MTKLLSLFLFPFILIGQNYYSNKTLDSIINKITFNQTTIIYVKDSLIITDTLPINKVKLVKKDPSIIVKFVDNRKEKIKANQFWGLITNFGERQRFFVGKIYVIWRTKAPYIYKINNGHSTNYFFSEQLDSKILSLNKNNIDNNVVDSQTRNWLNNYLFENITNLNSTKNKMGDIAETSIEIASNLFELIVSSIESNKAVQKNRRRTNEAEKRKLETDSLIEK